MNFLLLATVLASTVSASTPLASDRSSLMQSTKSVQLSSTGDASISFGLDSEDHEQGHATFAVSTDSEELPSDAAMVETETEVGATYSAEGQDDWVLSQIAKASTFLDIGARDGDFFSNTRRLEEHGWTGTCVEPFPSKFGKFHRTCTLVKKALVAVKNKTRIYSDCEDGSGTTGWSGFTKTNKNGMKKVGNCTRTEVNQTTFADLHGESLLPKSLGYVSLDVEGYELVILKAFPFDTHCSRLWSVEGAGNTYNEVQDAITDLLGAHGCKLVRQTVSDGLFLCANCTP